MVQNSYLNKFAKNKMGARRPQEHFEDSVSQSSRSIEQLSHNYSTQSAKSQEIGNSSTSCNLLEHVKKMKSFKIDSAQSVRNVLIKKGVRLFYDLNDNLNAYRQGFADEKTMASSVPWLKHKNGEKFEISPPDQYNYRQWEQYDTLDFQPMPHINLPASQPDCIELAQIPGYIRNDVCSKANPELNLSGIQSCKSGIKVGSQLRDNSARWIEKWFDISCRDQRVQSSKQVNVLNKNNIIEL